MLEKLETRQENIVTGVQGIMDYIAQVMKLCEYESLLN